LASTLHDPRYRKLIGLLVEARKAAGLSQEALAERVGRPQSYLGKIEIFERRLDALELFDLIHALDLSAAEFAHNAERVLSSRQKPRRR
jgi:transcriptional regulator with XRE-family HTH domain